MKKATYDFYIQISSEDPARFEELMLQIQKLSESYGFEAKQYSTVKNESEIAQAKKLFFESIQI